MLGVIEIAGAPLVVSTEPDVCAKAVAETKMDAVITKLIMKFFIVNFILMMRSLEKDIRTDPPTCALLMKYWPEDQPRSGAPRQLRC